MAVAIMALSAFALLAAGNVVRREARLSVRRGMTFGVVLGPAVVIYSAAFAFAAYDLYSSWGMR